MTDARSSSGTASAHTPTPWTLYSEDLRGGKYWTVSRPGETEAIDIHSSDNGEADAAFIVKAVNSHDALVKALTDVRKLISEAAMTGFNCHDGDWAERLFHSQQATSAALSQVRDTSAVAAGER